MDSHVKAQQIEAELVGLLYKQAPPAFAATILNAGIITCVLWSQVPPSLLITWLVLIGAITAWRFGLVRRYRCISPAADQAVYWRTRFIVGTGAAGAVWGAAAIFLFPSASIVHQVFLVFMLGGMAAGAVATLSSVMPAFFAFFLPVTLPITIRLFFEGSAVQIAMGFPLLAFVGMLLVTARQFHLSLTTSFNLRLDNLDLVQSLSFANKQAEGSNQQLIESNQALNRAILEMKASEERFRSLCAASPMAIFQADGEGNVSYTNLRWQEITGLTLEETFGLGSLRTVHLEDRQGVFAKWRASIAAGREFATELRFVRPTGDVRWVYVQAAPIRTDDGTVREYVGGAIDITERRAVDQMKDEFVSVVSHELRTPLTAIRGSLGLLASGRFGILQEKGRRMMEIAVQNTDRLVRLINDILDIERMQSGRATVVKVACDAAELMAQTVEVMQAIAGKAGVTLSVQPQSVRLWADPDRLIQTLANLLSNAIKFSPPGSQVWLTVEHQNDHALFQIKDQGRGIPADKIESIFERFQQVNASDSRDKGGTGLGLAICRSIVQQHGGRIWVESTPGTGSTFFFTLPLA